MADDLTFGVRITANGDEAIDAFKKISVAVTEVGTSVEEATQQSVMYDGALFRTNEALQAHILAQKENALAIQSAAKEVKSLEDVTGNMQEKANKLAAETLKQEAALRKAAEATAFNGKEVQALIARYDPLGATLRSAEADLGRLQKMMGNSERPEIINAFGAIENKIIDTKVKITEAEAATAAFGIGGAAGFKKVAEAAAKGTEGVKANSTVVRESLVLMREASVGNFTRMAGSASIMANAFGFMPAVLSGVGLAIGSVVVATIGLSYAFEKGVLEQEAMKSALIMTGNYAGATSGSLDAMAHSAAASGGSLSEAKKAVEELAGSGKFTSDQIGLISTAAVSMERATGVSVDSTIKQFESLAVETTGSSARSSSAITNATLKLDDQYHFLTLAVYEQIAALEKEGNAKEASRLATDEFAKSMKDRAAEISVDLGSIEKGWNSIKDSINGAISAIGDFGKHGAQFDVKKLTSKLSDFDVSHKDDNQNTKSVYSSERLKIVNDLAAAKSELLKVDTAATAQGASKLATSQAEHAAQQISLTTTQLQRNSQGELTTALKEYHAEVAKIAAVNPNDPLVSKNAVAAMDEAITKAHTQKAPKGPHVTDHVNAAYLSAMKEAAGLQDAAVGKSEGLTQAQIKLLDVERLMVDVKGRQVKLWDVLSPDKKMEIEQSFAAASAKEKENAANAEALRVKGIVGNFNASVDSHLGTQATKDDPTMSASDKAYADNVNFITKETAKYTAELQKLADQKSVVGKSTKLETDGITALTVANTAAIESAKALKVATDANNASWEYGATKALTTYKDSINNVAKNTEAIVTSSFKGMEDALIKFVQTGKLSFTSMANSIISDLIRIAIQKSITGPISNAIAGYFGNASTAATYGTNVGSQQTSMLAAQDASFNANGNVFGGSGIHAFANGGTFTNSIVDSPTPFKFASGGGFANGVMGEAGPEAVMPLTRGADGKLGVQSSGSSGGNSVVVNIIESPGNGGQQSQSSSNGVDTLTIMVEKIKNAVAGDILKGGNNISAAMSQTYGLNRTVGSF